MGAPQSRLFETAKGLKKAGWEVVVVTSMPNYPTGKIFDDYRGRLFTHENLDGIAIWRYTLFASNSRKSFPRVVSMLSFSIIVLFSYFKVKQIKPEYIFTESPPLTLGLSGLILSKCCNAKHILNVSDLWPLSAYKLGAISKGFVYSQLERLERFLYINSFACTGQSQEIIDQLQLKGSSKTLLFRNGVDCSRFVNISSIQNENNSKVKIVYAGLLGVAQGILSICQNIDFASLNSEFHIYGQGAEKTEIQEFILKNLLNDIILHSPLPREEIPGLLAKYDVTIVPLIKPIFGAVPSKIYEAMAAGLPIIFAGGGEGAGIIKKYQIGWVCEPSDFSAITNVIKYIEPDKLEKMKQRAKHTAQTMFDRNIQIEHLHNFLIKH
jgi:glycosyltransferase involved in cell wall biosynthesis